jgi:hypothetical protein
LRKLLNAGLPQTLTRSVGGEAVLPFELSLCHRLVFLWIVKISGFQEDSLSRIYPQFSREHKKACAKGHQFLLSHCKD